MPRTLKLILLGIGILVVLPEIIPIGLIYLLLRWARKGWKALMSADQETATRDNASEQG